MPNSLSNGIFTLQEFYNRGVIKLAPDVLVYIGGSLTTAVLAPVSSSNSNLSFNDGITTVSVQSNLDPPGSSTANIEITTPLYGDNSKYWALFPGIDSNTPVKAPLFQPMMEVKIFFKGRFLVNNQPKYYPSFWGFVTNVEEQYNGGVYKILLSCADMLHWWAFSKLNVHPIPESNIAAGGGQTLTVFATIFKRSNPYQILYQLTSMMGMSDFVTPAWVAQKTSLNEIYPANLMKTAATGIMAYWKARFSGAANLLKMYGINGTKVNKNGIQERQPEKTNPILSTDSQLVEGYRYKDVNNYILDIDYIRKFELFADYDKMGTFENSEYMTKLEIATTIKDRTDFEFFQDTNGNFVFKPPFYNLNVRGILPYTLLPNDIVSYALTTDVEGICTVLTVNTPMYKNLRTTTFDLGKGFHMDIDLAKRYGIRDREITLEYVYDAGMARTLALGQMNVMNAKTVVGNVSIPGRPELRLGYPIYIEHRDSFHYVKSITHSFDYGGSFTTTLSLETERKKRYSDNDVASGDLNIMPLKDQVYRLKPGSVAPPKSNPKDPPPLWPVSEKEIKQQDLLGSQYKISSLTQGEYALDTRANLNEYNVTQNSVPFTDEDGYQVIGSFAYGRNLNPILMSSETSGPPILKDVYLTTMARPVYQSESDSMNILFFDKQEGAVPAYLNTANNEMPATLGRIVDIDSSSNYVLTQSLTTSQLNDANDLLTPPITGETYKALVNAGVQFNVPAPPGASPLVNKQGQ